jgi:hypothetical protein
MRPNILWCLTALFALSAETASALSEPDEWAAKIKTAQSVGPLGTNLFGDSTNFYNGVTSFSTADIDLPGNDALPVRVTRTKSATTAEDDGDNGLLGNWELDLPYVSGIYSKTTGWTVAVDTAPYQRCSSDKIQPPTIYFTSSDYYDARQYWRGLTLSVPGAGQQTLLKPSAGVPAPTDGLGGKLVTKAYWQTRCGVNIANPSAAPGYSGEGFIALAPDGTKYTFTWMMTRPWSTLASGSSATSLDRVEVRIYATKVEDRFGNYVNYNWSGQQLSNITASDGRQISFGYNTNGKITSAAAHGKTWLYGYSGNSLTSVTLPDNSAWTISTGALSIGYDWHGPPPDCTQPDSWYPADQQMVWTFTHPSGAKGEFTFKPVRHGRTEITKTVWQMWTAIPTGTTDHRC